MDVSRDLTSIANHVEDPDDQGDNGERASNLCDSARGPWPWWPSYVQAKRLSHLPNIGPIRMTVNKRRD